MEKNGAYRQYALYSTSGFLMATLREISQTGSTAQWAKDKQIMLSSLEDFQYFTFDDLDYLGPSQSILASFANFKTEDIIQLGTFKGAFDDAYEPFGHIGQHRVRLYYYPDLTDLSDGDNPVVGSDIVANTYNLINIFGTTGNSNLGDGWPAYDIEGNLNAFAVNSVGYLETEGIDKENQFTQVSCVLDKTTRTVTHPTNTDIVADMKVSGDDIPNGTTVSSKTDDTSFVLSRSPIENDASATLTFSVGTGVFYKQHYIVLDNEENPDYGITWSENFKYRIDNDDTVDWSLYSWKITHSAWTDIDIVINDARFLNVDKQFRLGG